MISNICKIQNGTEDLNEILCESEKVALYMGLDKRQALQLRLICEEVDGMLPKIIDNFSGDFWIECEQNICTVNANINIPELNTNKKEELIKVSKSKKNALAVGIVGKIRNAIENFFLTEKSAVSYNASSGEFYLSSGIKDANYSYIWSLADYKGKVDDKDQEKWDELEKSIIANLADDIIIGVKGKQANIKIIKRFN